MEEINRIEDVLLLDKNITKLTIYKPPAKGVGSLMLKVTVSTKDKEEDLHLVAKKVPLTEIARERFQIQTTFPKEVAFYNDILPALWKFQKEEGITEELDTFPKFYGARFNLHGQNQEVDQDAVLLLEDLSFQGDISYSIQVQIITSSI